jgi:hypothetical protein
MQIGKIYFIHLRDINKATGHYEQKGGATVAWKVEENGDLIIGHPALCHSNDNFVKSHGRDVAGHNLVNLLPLEVYTAAELASIALAAGIPSLNFSTLTPAARIILISKLAEIAGRDIAGTMSTQWFESFIRSRIFLHKGRVHTAFEEGDAEDAVLIIKAEQLFGDLHENVMKSFTVNV